MEKKTTVGIKSSTNNYVIRLWSKKHYGKKASRTRISIFSGHITNVQTKKQIKFHTVGQMLSILEKCYFEDDSSKNITPITKRGIYKCIKH